MYKFLIPLFALAFLLVSCDKSAAPANSNTAAPTTKTAHPTRDATANTPTATKADPDSALGKAQASFDGKYLTGKHTVIIKTSMGDITVSLDGDAAPKTVTNFLLLAKAGYYDDIAFHRVIPGFMIQGGDPNGDGTGGESIYGPTFPDEINADSYGLQTKTVKDAAQGQELPPEIANLTIKQFYEQQGFQYDSTLESLPMTKGAIAMANRGPNTNGSQFFIVHADSTPWLEGKHTVFGRVVAGMDVVDSIANVSRDENDHPNEPIKFTMQVKD